MVLQEARRASGVVRRLLDFSRQGERLRARADLNEVINDVIALTRHLILTNDVILKLDLDESLPWISIDTNQMKQVLLNLIHNALQAMKSGGELVVSTFDARRENRDWIVMSVRDNGTGISPEDQIRIFEPFFTTKGDRGGTGLGLSVTYGIVTNPPACEIYNLVVQTGDCTGDSTYNITINFTHIFELLSQQVYQC